MHQLALKIAQECALPTQLLPAQGQYCHGGMHVQGRAARLPHDLPKGCCATLQASLVLLTNLLMTCSQLA